MIRGAEGGEKVRSLCEAETARRRRDPRPGPGQWIPRARAPGAAGGEILNLETV